MIFYINAYLGKGMSFTFISGKYRYWEKNNYFFREGEGPAFIDSKNFLYRSPV